MQKVPPTLDIKFLGCWFKTIKVEMYEMFKFTWFGIYDDKARSTTNTTVSPEQNQRVVVFSKILAISCSHPLWIIFLTIELLVVVLFHVSSLIDPPSHPWIDNAQKQQETIHLNHLSSNTWLRLRININIPSITFSKWLKGAESWNIRHSRRY